MSLRCPTARYRALGCLRGWRWVIGPRGYANVVAAAGHEEGNGNGVGVGDGGKGGEEEEVYGLLYELQPEDESALDKAEGVPVSYVKMVSRFAAVLLFFLAALIPGAFLLSFS